MLNSIEKIPHCEIFRPTSKEFQDFSGYLEKVTKQAKAGVFKVIPPHGWKARKDNYRDLEFTIPHPIEQIVSGKDGYYELFLMTRESRTLSKYEKLVESFDKIAEGKSPEDTEKLFWRTIKFSSPLYGADAPGSLFDKGVAWNLSEIDSLLKKGLDKDITGVTTPYLYFGSWKAMFAWHKEDLDLYSINFLHFGKPKCWYAIKQEDDHKFQEFATEHFPEAAKECPEFLRHKTYLINPGILYENGFQLSKCVQYPGEFVITKCAGYHAGFNMGLNCAEAVNFALKNWVDYGKSASYCKCQKDSVKIDMHSFDENLHKRKEPTQKVIASPQKVIPSSQNDFTPPQDAPRKKTEKPKNLLKKKTQRKKQKENNLAIENEEIETWLNCDCCNKWRKIPKNAQFDQDKYANGFVCDFIRGLECETPEEKWRTKYTTVKRKVVKSEIPKRKLQKYYASMKNSM